MKEIMNVNRSILTAVLIVACTVGVHSCSEGNKSTAKNQWYLNSENGVGISEINNYFSNDKTSKEVVVALIDSGVDYNHEALENAMWTNLKEVGSDGKDNDNNGYIDDIHGYNFVDNRGDVAFYKADKTENQHGTMCAGIIVAKQKRRGMIGVAACLEDKVKIMTLKVLRSDEIELNGSVNDIVSAIEYAESNGASICNMSFNIKCNDNRLEKAIKNSKMLFVVSAGNGNPMGTNIELSKTYPASYNFDNVITVANSDYKGRLSKTSNYGNKSVDVVAPGTKIMTTSMDDEYNYASGTSFSTPIVAAFAALILSHVKTELTACDVKKYICSGTKEMKDDNDKEKIKYGIVDGSQLINSLTKKGF